MTDESATTPSDPDPSGRGAADATTDPATTPFRILVVAAEEVHGAALRDAVAEHVRDHDRAAVRLIAPALTKTALENAMGDVDGAMVAARERLAHSAEELKRAGIEAETAVGDSDLHLAIQDALQTFAADEIVIVAHRDGASSVERQGIAESERDVDPPITELYVERHDGSEPTIADVEELPAGHADAAAGERRGSSENLPPYSPRDLLGIIVAIVGTIVLVVLAAAGSDNNLNALSAQSVTILIAGAVGLLNVAHVVGLTLFQANAYRGFGRGLFARLSLYGTPLAIVVCLLIR
ncbi:MAG: hypothetical protein GEU88_13855 [Solirubrobacterales bacterium]|nr:hypothetical protein [Solirubrobacterales bacterium]